MPIPDSRLAFEYVTDRILGRWIRATWLGWTLGLLLTIAAALTSDLVGIGESQTLVGAAMGAGVGFVQGRAMRGILSKPRAWVLSSVAGLAAPFLVFDIARAVGWQLPFSLYIAVALGGLATGSWQVILLRPYVRNAWMWVLGSTVGWSLAAASAAVADTLPKMLSLRGLAGAGMYLGVVLMGGLVLGLITGLVLVRLESATEGRRAARA